MDSLPFFEENKHLSFIILTFDEADVVCKSLDA